MLLDDFFPDYDVSEHHAIRIQASTDAVYAAIRTADLAAGAITRVLLMVRALPSWVRGRTRAQRSPGRVTLAAFERHGFVVLAENPPRELLIGLQGQFWTLAGNIEPFDATAAQTPVPSGRARAGWNFAVAPAEGGQTLLTTETRVICADAATRRRFRCYWLLVRPGSGLIRRGMLRSIRRSAERPV